MQFFSILIKNIQNYFDPKYYGKLLSIDLARVFGSSASYDLFEYEDYRENIAEICLEKGLIKPKITSQLLTTFCIAESLSNDLVLDFKGNLYRCWNNVFDEKYKIGTLEELIERNADPFETSNVTLELVEKFSLNSSNKGDCFKCKYCKYCQGLCPNIRKGIVEGIEENIYNDEKCKEIIKKRLTQIIKFLGG